MTDLQTGVEIDGNAIEGTLKYVTGYTGFSGDVSEQTGNYLVLHFEAPGASRITVELVNGNVGHPVTLDTDGILIVRISNKATQYLKVKAYSGDHIETRSYSLTGLTLNNA